MLGAGVVGHWVGPGQRNIPRPTEYIKIDRRAIREKDGKLSFRLMEPMEEVVYLDQVRLLAVDHPNDYEVYPNEYFASNPPYPSFKVVASRNPRPPAGAWDDHGHDVLPDLRAHRYIGDFELLPFKGFAKLHSLELDLGEPYRSGPLRLLLHGEIEYFTATGMYAADQAGIDLAAKHVATDGDADRRDVDDREFTMQQLANIDLDAPANCVRHPLDPRCPGTGFDKNTVGNLSGNLLYHLTDHVLFNFSSTYDVRDTRFIGFRAITKLLSFCECWTATFGVKHDVNPAKTSFSFDFSLLGLGNSKSSLK